METERFKLPDGSEVGTGLLMPTAAQQQLAMAAPVYGENFYLEPKDIEKALKGDVYKTFRRLRQPYMLNQGSNGSCNAEATVGAFHNRRLLDGLKHVALSSKHLYMNINGGRDSGSMLDDGLRYAATKGISPKELKVDGKPVVFPHNVFNKRQISSQLLREADIAATSFLSHEAFRLPVDTFANFKIALASAMAQDHQVIFAWMAGGNATNLRNGYVQQARGMGNHATLFHSGKWVGGADLVHPDCQNSWGPSANVLYGPVNQGVWDGGFGLFTMESAYQCAKFHTFWVLPGTRVIFNKDGK